MKHKLKHLSRFCCKPANELEFEAVKMAAEIGGIHWYEENEFKDTIDYPFLMLDEADDLICYMDADSKQLISTLYFCNKLRMTEEEAEKLEDDRVASDVGNNWEITDGAKVFKALNGHYFKTNEDGTEVTLHKR
jgi:hypothetical protein